MTDLRIKTSYISNPDEILSIVSSFDDDLSFYSSEDFTTSIRTGTIFFFLMKLDTLVQGYCLVRSKNKEVQMYRFKKKNNFNLDHFGEFLNDCFEFGKKLEQPYFLSVIAFRFSNDVINRVSSYGFAGFKRFNMTLQLPECSFQQPDLTGFSIQSNIGDYTNEIIEFIMLANKDELDAKIYPDFSDRSILEKILGFEKLENHSFSEKASLLLFKDSRLIGLTLIKIPNESTAEVFEIAIHPEFRRKKLGYRLMICSILALQELGMKELLLTISSGNPAQLVYESIGFKKQEDSYITVFRKNYDH